MNVVQPRRCYPDPDPQPERCDRTMKRHQLAFGLLILTQAAHSIEEYFGRLWESFPPAYLVSGLVSQDRQLGFLVLNVASSRSAPGVTSCLSSGVGRRRRESG